jgi:hypothetical protein
LKKSEEETPEETVIETVSHKHEKVPSTLGSLTFKKSKKYYKVIGKDGKIVAELYAPFNAGPYHIPCWAVWHINPVDGKSILDEVFASLSSALDYIQKKFIKK